MKARVAALSMPARVRAAAAKLWASGRPLAAEAGATPVLPLLLRLARPSARALLDNSAALDAELRTLLDEEGAGRYTITWCELRFRRSGTQRWPVQVQIGDLQALADWLGFSAHLSAFRALVGLADDKLPEARLWLGAAPMRALQVAEAFPRMLEVARQLRATPRPDRYLRELEVPGVDSKFIERHYAVLASLLDTLLPVAAVDWCARASGPAGFARRYGFAFPRERVRLRLLDLKLAPVPGLSELELPLRELALWRIPCDTVFITENKISGLSFPEVENAIVLFGMGHALRRLELVPWLLSKRLIYWGDLDTHGFAMLSALRRRFPHTQSLLMDQQTLFEHQPWWGQEAPGERWLHPLAHLDPAESALFEGLRTDRWGNSVRLEQERVGFSWLRAALAGLLNHPLCASKTPISIVPSSSSATLNNSTSQVGAQ